MLAPWTLLSGATVTFHVSKNAISEISNTKCHNESVLLPLSPSVILIIIIIIIIIVSTILIIIIVIVIVVIIHFRCYFRRFNIVAGVIIFLLPPLWPRRGWIMALGYCYHCCFKNYLTFRPHFIIVTIISNDRITKYRFIIQELMITHVLVVM